MRIRDRSLYSPVLSAERPSPGAPCKRSTCERKRTSSIYRHADSGRAIAAAAYRCGVPGIANASRALARGRARLGTAGVVSKTDCAADRSGRSTRGGRAARGAGHRSTGKARATATARVRQPRIGNIRYRKRRGGGRCTREQCRLGSRPRIDPAVSVRNRGRMGLDSGQRPGGTAKKRTGATCPRDVGDGPGRLQEGLRGYGASRPTGACLRYRKPARLQVVKLEVMASACEVCRRQRLLARHQKENPRKAGVF